MRDWDPFNRWRKALQDIVNERLVESRTFTDLDFISLVLSPFHPKIPAEGTPCDTIASQLFGTLIAPIVFTSIKEKLTYPRPCVATWTEGGEPIVLGSMLSCAKVQGILITEEGYLAKCNDIVLNQMVIFISILNDDTYRKLATMIQTLQAHFRKTVDLVVSFYNHHKASEGHVFGIPFKSLTCIPKWIPESEYEPINLEFIDDLHVKTPEQAEREISGIPLHEGLPCKHEDYKPVETAPGWFICLLCRHQWYEGDQK